MRRVLAPARMLARDRGGKGRADLANLPSEIETGPWRAPQSENQAPQLILPDIY